jgi:hypothetical protein
MHETAPFMGDWSFWNRIERLCSAPNALLERSPAPFRFGQPADDFRAQRLSLTSIGRNVLANRADRLSLQPIDTWLGGVHLVEGAPMWRWNDATGTVESDE